MNVEDIKCSKMTQRHLDLTDEQYYEFCDAFTYFARGTERIDRIDLKIIFDSLRSLEKMTDDDLQDFCDLVDKEGYGITLEPFLQLMEQQVKQDPRANLKKAFDEIDKDGSGTLDHDELRTIINKLLPGQYTETELTDMIAAADLDGDGEIDFIEFSKMMESVNEDN